MNFLKRTASKVEGNIAHFNYEELLQMKHAISREMSKRSSVRCPSCKSTAVHKWDNEHMAYFVCSKCGFHFNHPESAPTFSETSTVVRCKEIEQTEARFHFYYIEDETLYDRFGTITDAGLEDEEEDWY